MSLSQARLGAIWAISDASANRGKSEKGTSVGLEGGKETGSGRRDALFGLVAVAAALVAVYALFWAAVTGDMQTFLEPWLDTILAKGRIGAFAEPFSNYTPPYLYLLSLFSLLVGLLSKYSVIKLLALFGALLLGAATLRLIRVAGASAAQPSLALWVMLLPSVILNVGMGQCDAFWAAACVMAVTSAIERRPVAMLVWFGVGIAFKAQAIFLAPFILQSLLAERTPFRLWPLPGLVYALAMLPAILVGWPLFHAATVYLRQAAWGETFIGNAANPWSFVHYLAPAGGMDWLWLGYLAALAAAGLYLFAFRGGGRDPRRLVALALLATMIVPFLLPKMHERFFFLADILSFVMVFVWRDRRAILIFLLVQCASILATMGMFLFEPAMPMAGAPLMLGAIILTIGGLLRAGPDDRVRPPEVGA
jgi:Gpi18-like mannosyltransferase